MWRCQPRHPSTTSTSTRALGSGASRASALPTSNRLPPRLPAPDPTCRPPGLSVIAASITPGSGALAIAPPAAGTWAPERYELRACLKSEPTRCLAPPVACGPANVTACTVAGLLGDTCYAVAVTAISGAIRVPGNTSVDLCTTPIP